MKLAISPSKENITNLVSRNYEETQLLEIVNFRGTINELNDQYPIECVREDRSIYRVSYLGNGAVAVLLFDDSGNKIYGNIYSTQLSKSNFDGLAEGHVLEDVRAIDSEGQYYFLYSGRNDTPKVSSHYTNDGYLITIEYDDENSIVRITKELI